MYVKFIKMSNLGQCQCLCCQCFFFFGLELYIFDMDMMNNELASFDAWGESLYSHQVP